MIRWKISTVKGKIRNKKEERKTGIMLALYHRKVPVVMPRQHKHGEHITDHQARRVFRRETYW
jgi:hypothetical protein